MNCPDCNQTLVLGLAGYYPCRCNEPRGEQAPITETPEFGRDLTISGEKEALEITAIETNMGRIDLRDTFRVKSGAILRIGYRLRAPYAQMVGRGTRTNQTGEPK